MIMKPSFEADEFLKYKTYLDITKLSYFMHLLGFALLYPAYGLTELRESTRCCLSLNLIQ